MSSAEHFLLALGFTAGVWFAIGAHQLGAMFGRWTARRQLRRLRRMLDYSRSLGAL